MRAVIHKSVLDVVLKGLVVLGRSNNNVVVLCVKSFRTTATEI